MSNPARDLHDILQEEQILAKGHKTETHFKAANRVWGENFSLSFHSRSWPCFVQNLQPPSGRLQQQTKLFAHFLESILLFAVSKLEWTSLRFLRGFFFFFFFSLSFFLWFL
jgi:hypothetical protein